MALAGVPVFDPHKSAAANENTLSDVGRLLKRRLQANLQHLDPTFKFGTSIDSDGAVRRFAAVAPIFAGTVGEAPFRQQRALRYFGLEADIPTAYVRTRVIEFPTPRQASSALIDFMDLNTDPARDSTAGILGTTRIGGLKTHVGWEAFNYGSWLVTLNAVTGSFLVSVDVTKAADPNGDPASVPASDTALAANLILEVAPILRGGTTRWASGRSDPPAPRSKRERPRSAVDDMLETKAPALRSALEHVLAHSGRPFVVSDDPDYRGDAVPFARSLWTPGMIPTYIEQAGARHQFYFSGDAYNRNAFAWVVELPSRQRARRLFTIVQDVYRGDRGALSYTRLPLRRIAGIRTEVGYITVPRIEDEWELRFTAVAGKYIFGSTSARLAGPGSGSSVADVPPWYTKLNTNLVRAMIPVLRS